MDAGAILIEQRWQWHIWRRLAKCVSTAAGQTALHAKMFGSLIDDVTLYAGISMLFSQKQNLENAIRLWYLIFDHEAPLRSKWNTQRFWV